MKEFSVYVHIPFCFSKCKYCDFNSFSGKDDLIESYVKKVIEEINLDNSFNNEYICKTIYIGGGTPSYIDSKYIKKIINAITNKYNVDKNVEITIEQNPTSMNLESLKLYKEIGINRLSIGLQTTNDELLCIIGRKHTYSMFLEKYNLARSIGFENINIDLMIALPNESLEMVNEDIEKIIYLKPKHISCYSLILYENVPLYDLIKKKLYVLPNDDLERKMYYLVAKKLKENGYYHYEISNFCRDKFYCNHNLMCWRQYEYVGFGLGAHSFVGNVRYCNVSNIEQYIKQNRKNILEKMNDIDLEKEYMILACRLVKDIDVQRFQLLYNNDLFKVFEKEIAYLVNNKYIEVKNNKYISLTQKGIDYNNQVCEMFV